MPNGKKNKPTRGSSNDPTRLLEVCQKLNDQKAEYALAGGWALNLHGIMRTTYDIDLLIPKNIRNTEKILEALSSLTFGIAQELDAAEVTQKPITIIGDIPRVDLLTVAGKTKYEEAQSTILSIKIEGVIVPFIDLENLIKSKQTDRLQDQADVEKLKQLRVQKK